MIILHIILFIMYSPIFSATLIRTVLTIVKHIKDLYKLYELVEWIWNLIVNSGILENIQSLF